MNALGILAGPRKGKSTDKMIDSVLSGLNDNGHTTEKISLYDYDIKPCTGCCSCEKTRKCVIKDDISVVMDKMNKADVIVFGSPTYWNNVTSEAKKLFDRSAEFFEMTAMGPKRKEENPSHVVLVTTCGAPFPLSHMMGIIPGIFRAMKVYFKRTRAKLHTIYVPGMLDAEKSSPSEKVLQKAYRLGRNL